MKRFVLSSQIAADRADRVLICPDDVLHTLPFGALVTRVGDSRNASRYFIDQFRLDIGHWTLIGH